MTANNEGYGNRSPLYVSDDSPIMTKVSMHCRRKIFSAFMKSMKPAPDTKVLDLGVTSDEIHVESNFFEKWYPYKDMLVCAGVEGGKYLERKFPGVRFVQIVPNEQLPFNDQEFDILFSNAVIEHVGTKLNQSFFLREIFRVSKSFFITTPNRWFPVEHHTGVPFLHFLPLKGFRFLVGLLGFDFYAREENLNPLSRRSFTNLLPYPAKVNAETVRLLGLSSNLMLWGSSQDQIQ
ncbi:MAG: methyltransferase domain-containing protein [Desulfomonilaceae bacterium]